MYPLTEQFVTCKVAILRDPCGVPLPLSIAWRSGNSSPGPVDIDSRALFGNRTSK